MPKHIYSDALADQICARLEQGESLNAICKDDGMPDERTVRGWARDDYKGFFPKYARAREIGYLKVADELLEIADDARNDWMDKHIRGETIRVIDDECVKRSQLRVETRKWLLSKMLPKVYGDKLQTEHSGSVAVTDTVDRPPNETREEWIARRKRILATDTAMGAAARPANGRDHS
jgi:hypothetical protein